jgi:hypothetical protein
MVLAGSLALAGSFAACHKQRPPPSIDGLSAALERSAEKTLAAPSLADEQIDVPAKAGQTDSQTREITRAFAAAGGTAVSSVNAEGQISILGAIPEVNVAAFKAVLRHEPAAMQKGPATPTRLIEVLIENAPPSSPMP